MAIFSPFYRHEQEVYRLDLCTSVVDEPNVEDQSFVGSFAMPLYIGVALRFRVQKTAVPDAAARVGYVPWRQALCSPLHPTQSMQSSGKESLILILCW